MTVRGALTLLGGFASVHDIRISPLDFFSYLEERLTYELDRESGVQSLSRSCRDKASPGSEN